MFDKQPFHAPDLLTYLVEVFSETKQGAKMGKLASRGIFQFVEFAKEHLSENRPTTVFPEADNYGITLSNNKRVIISPRKEAPDTLDTGDAIQITAQGDHYLKDPTLRDYTKEDSAPYQSTMDREEVKFDSKKPVNRKL